MDDPRALFERHEIAQIDWRCSVVERVTKANQFECPALCRRHDLSVQLITLEARGNQFLREQQMALGGRYERVCELRMHVQRLIGGNRPRRRRPYQYEDRPV